MMYFQSKTFACLIWQKAKCSLVGMDLCFVPPYIFRTASAHCNNGRDDTSPRRQRLTCRGRKGLWWNWKEWFHLPPGFWKLYATSVGSFYVSYQHDRACYIILETRLELVRTHPKRGLHNCTSISWGVALEYRHCSPNSSPQAQQNAVQLEYGRWPSGKHLLLYTEKTYVAAILHLLRKFALPGQLW